MLRSLLLAQATTPPNFSYVDAFRESWPLFAAIFKVLPIVGMSDFYSSWLILLAFVVVASAIASLLALRKYVRV